MKPIPNILSWPLLCLLGIGSGILSVASPVGGRWGPLLYVGLVYGATLGVYFVSCRSERSAIKISLLVLASTLAYPFGYAGSGFGLFLPLPLLQGETPIGVILAAGMLGGFALLLPILLLFGSCAPNRKAVLAKVAVGSLLSGVVGVVAWALGPSLGEEIWMLLPWTLLPNVPTQSPETFHFIALYLVWQPIMALFIGVVTSRNASAIAEFGSEKTAPVP
jgi:hypothetical protein